MVEQWNLYFVGERYGKPSDGNRNFLHVLLRQLFACYFLRRFPASIAIPSFLTSHHTKLSRFLSRSGQTAHAFVLLSDFQRESGATLTSRNFAHAAYEHTE